MSHSLKYSIILSVLLWSTSLFAFSQEVRKQPLRSSNVKSISRTIQVKSISELKDVLENLNPKKEKGWTLISLENGEHRILDVQGKYLTLENWSNLILDFNNSEIIFEKPGGLLNITNCKNVIIRNATIDFDPIPYTQGTVLGIDKETKQVTVKVKHGWKLPGDNYRKMGKNWMLIKDTEITGKQKRGCRNVYTIQKDWEQIDEETYRVTFVDVLTNIEKGDRFVHLGPGGGNCFSLSATYQITVENISQYAGGVFMGARRADATNILNCSVKIKPGTDRWHSLTRDILIELDSRIGPWIEDCFFEANGDDGINLHTKGFKIIERVSDFKIVVGPEVNQFNKLNPVYLFENDSITVFDNFLGKLHFKGLVTKVKNAGEGQYLVRLNKKLPDFPEINMKLENIDSRYEAWNTSLICPGFVIRSNTFKNQRRFALLTLSKNGIIEENKFIGSSANAIYMGYLEEHSDIGQMSGNITIRNNIFDDCFVQDKTPSIKFQASAINVTLPLRPDKSLSPNLFFKNVTITKNQFINFNDDFPIVRLHNTANCALKYNQFINCISEDNMIEMRAGEVKNEGNVFSN